MTLARFRDEAEAKAEQVERNAHAKATDARLVGEATNAIEAERLGGFPQWLGAMHVDWNQHDVKWR